jgi:hypothetical protein
MYISLLSILLFQVLKMADQAWAFSTFGSKGILKLGDLAIDITIIDDKEIRLSRIGICNIFNEYVKELQQVRTERDRAIQAELTVRKQLKEANEKLAILAKRNALETINNQQ